MWNLTGAISSLDIFQHRKKHERLLNIMFCKKGLAIMD